MRKMLYLCSFFFFLISCKNPPVTLENSPVYPSPPSSDYKLVWKDDFNGKTLDMDKWGYRANGSRRQGWNSPKSVIIDTISHNLIIRNVLKNDTAFTGMIGGQGKFEQKYGFFEIRAKIPTVTKGYWPAFWIQSPLIGNTLNPVESGTEIDVMEFIDGDPTKVNHAVHWNGYGANLQSKSWETVSNTFLDNGFHTYALEWNPKFYKFYIDSHLVWTVNEPISATKQFIILSCEIGDKKLFKAKFGDQNADFVVDYVKVYEWTGQ